MNDSDGNSETPSPELITENIPSSEPGGARKMKTRRCLKDIEIQHEGIKMLCILNPTPSLSYIAIVTTDDQHIHLYLNKHQTELLHFQSGQALENMIGDAQ